MSSFIDFAKSLGQLTAEKAGCSMTTKHMTKPKKKMKKSYALTNPAQPKPVNLQMGIQEHTPRPAQPVNLQMGIQEHIPQPGMPRARATTGAENAGTARGAGSGVAGQVMPFALPQHEDRFSDSRYARRTPVEGQQPQGFIHEQTDPTQPVGRTDYSLGAIKPRMVAGQHLEPLLQALAQNHRRMIQPAAVPARPQLPRNPLPYVVPQEIWNNNARNVAGNPAAGRDLGEDIGAHYGRFFGGQEHRGPFRPGQQGHVDNIGATVGRTLGGLVGRSVDYFRR